MSTARFLAGTTGKFTATLRDSAGSAIAYTGASDAGLQTLTLTLKDAETGAVVNSRSAQNVLGSNNVSVTSGGALTWHVQTADTAIQTAGNSAEDHIAEFTFTHFSSSELKTGKAIFTLRCTDYAPICTYDDVRLHMPGISTTDQQWVESMIEAFTARVEYETGRKLRRATVTETFSTVPGQRSLRVSRYPIEAVTSVKESSGGDFGDIDATDADAYEFLSAGDKGLITMQHRPFQSGAASVQVTYTGGLLRTDSGGATWAPPDLRTAAVRQIVYQIQRRNMLGVTGETVSGASVSILAEQDLLEDVRRVVDSFRPIGLY